MDFSQYNWPAPRLVAESKEANRADQGNTITANEYLDSPKVLDQKMEVLAAMIRQSKFTVAYTGAGISKSSGIPDYATKAKNSIVAGPKISSPLDALPTYAHLILTAMGRQNMLHSWVQQNHDGLPQKAGYPQEKLNEIHGAWFDPSNPVVQFNESLRTDLFEWMQELEDKTELCLCLGTSLSGMNADRMARTPAKRFQKGRGLGTVIINLQRTPIDELCSLRVWAKLDDAFKILAEKLELSQRPVKPLQYPSEVFTVPYNAQGKLDWNCEMTLDLRQKSKLKICAPGSMMFGCIAEIRGRRDNHWEVWVDNSGRRSSGYILGWWWPDVLMRGAVPHLPLMNVNAEVRARAQITPPKALRLVQHHDEIEGKQSNAHNWSLQVKGKHCQFVESVRYHLHPTFHPSSVEETEAPFKITRTGWGTFVVDFEIRLVPALGHLLVEGSHQLDFENDRTVTRIRLPTLEKNN